MVRDGECVERGRVARSLRGRSHVYYQCARGGHYAASRCGDQGAAICANGDDYAGRGDNDSGDDRAAHF